MKHLLTLGLCAVFGFMSTGVFAQDGWNWPADPNKAQLAKEKYVMHTDSRKTGDLKGQHETIVWLLQNTPDLSVNVYKAAITVFEEMVDVEKEAKRKFELQDSAMLIYDLRIKYFGEEVDVLNRKLYTGYQYYANRNDKLEGLVKDFARLFEISSFDQIEDYHALFYMDALRRHKKNNNAPISDEEVMEIYEKLIAFLDHKSKKASPRDKENIEKWRGQIDGILSDVVTIDCNFIETNLGPKFYENTSDLEVAKKILALSINLSCLDTQVFADAAKSVYDSQPEKGLAKVLARKAISNNDLNGAIAYYEQAIKMSDDNVEQADMMMTIGNIYNNKGQKAKARDLYLDAVKLDPSQREAYSKIGDMIMNSYDQCKREVSRVEDRAIFIAAFEMYRMAGNTARMNQAKAQFPTAEMIFTEGKEVGQEVRVGCWIQTSVKIQRAE
jgi:tetratricopeptide (TPR) repeat protein